MCFGIIEIMGTRRDETGREGRKPFFNVQDWFGMIGLVLGEVFPDHRDYNGDGTG